MRSYAHADYTKRDMDRHERAIKSARKKGLMRSCRSISVVVSGRVKLAKTVLTRSLKCWSEGVWNLPRIDKNTLDWLLSAGLKVVIYLWDELKDEFEEVEYSEFIEGASPKYGRGGGPDYYQVRR